MVRIFRKVLQSAPQPPPKDCKPRFQFEIRNISADNPATVFDWQAKRKITPPIKIGGVIEFFRNGYRPSSRKPFG